MILGIILGRILGLILGLDTGETGRHRAEIGSAVPKESIRFGMISMTPMCRPPHLESDRRLG